MRRGLIMWFALFILMPLSAQLPEHLCWHHLGAEDGLRNSVNTFMHKDSRGFVWMGSPFGLQRYDGNPFPMSFGTLPADPKGIKGQNVQGTILEDKKGDIWITTYQALNHYDYKLNKFTPYFFKGSIENTVGGFFSCGHTEQGLWLLYKEKIYQFDLEEKVFTEVYQTGKILNRGMVIESQGLTYLYAFNVGFDAFSSYVFRGKQLIKDTTISIPGTAIQSMMPMGADRVLLGISDGVLEYDLQSDQSTFQSTSAIKGEVNSFSKLSQDSILFGTSNGDIFCFNLLTEQINKVDFSILKSKDSNDGINSIYTSSDGTILVSAKKTGLYYTNKNKVKFSRKFSGRVVTGVIQTEDGNILVFTNQGVMLLNEAGDFIKNCPTKDHNKDHSLMSFFLRDKAHRIYTSYFWGIKTYNPDKNNFQGVKTFNRLNYTILLNDNRALVSDYRREGLYELNPERNALSDLPIPGSEAISEVTFSYENEVGDLILAEGLSKISFYNSKTFSQKYSIPYSGEITAMYEYPGDSLLWIGSAIGLTTFNYRTKKIEHVKGRPAIPGNDVYGILPGAGDDLWLSTNQGLCQIDRLNKKVTKYTIADGLPTMEFIRNSYFKLRDGRLAFGTMNGLIIFDPQSIKSNIPLAKPTITQIWINGEMRQDLKCTKNEATNCEEIVALELSPIENRLEFHFSALEFSHPKNNWVRYRLLPDEDKWSEEVNGGKCQYANLSPNTYTLEVQAVNSDGIRNPESKKLTIKILPHWYQRWYFILLMFLFAGGVIAMFSIWTQKRKQKILQLEYAQDIALEKQRVLISRNMHDDLGSALSAIKLKTSVMSMKSKNPEYKKELKQLSTRIKSIDQKIQEAIWTVDARNDSLEKLIDYLVDHIRDLFDGQTTRYELLLPTELPKYMVSGDFRRMVVLAYKEILNNIIKHAGAKNIWVTIVLFHKETMQIVIKDDGVGFDVKEKELGNGNGLDNMRFRMEKIGGTCRFLPVKKGTSVELTFNLKRN